MLSVVKDPRGSVHPLLLRALGACGAPVEGARDLERCSHSLASSPAALRRFLELVDAQFDRNDVEMLKQQAIVDEACREAVTLNETLQERAKNLEEALRAREKDHQALEEARQQLMNSEKLASIGTLAAGIAHEINTPTQFVGDNLSFLNDAFRDLMKVLEDLLASAPAYRAPEGVMDLEFLRVEIPEALQQSVEGLERVAKIVRSVKEFSHPGTTGRKSVDLNRAIQSTLMVCRNEWKYVAEVETDLDPNLPLVPCVPGEINQVLLNLIINGAQAIEDRRASVKHDVSGHIKISTRRDGAVVRISVADNGCGIPEEVAGRVYDPFFTTKEVGRGTGQGLAIAHSVVVKNHQGEISFESRPGEGTTFHLFLPLAGSLT